MDYRGKLPGRGAWVTPSREVIERLQSNPKLLKRALKAQVSADGLLEQVREANHRALMDGLSLAARSGAAVSGGARVREAIASGKVVGLLFASDCSPRNRTELMGRCSNVPTADLPLTVEELGARVGKGPRSVIAVVRSSTGRNLRRELDRWVALR